MCFEYAEKIPTNIRLTDHAKSIYKDIGNGKFSLGVEVAARKLGIYCQGHDNYEVASGAIKQQAELNLSIDAAVQEWIMDGLSLPAMLIALGQMIADGSVAISADGLQLKKASRK
jgi:hypothetical protein